MHPVKWHAEAADIAQLFGLNAFSIYQLSEVDFTVR